MARRESSPLRRGLGALFQEGLRRLVIGIFGSHHSSPLSLVFDGVLIYPIIP
jgi:hypothetical protein